MNYRHVDSRDVVLLAAAVTALLSLACGGSDGGRDRTPVVQHTTVETPGIPSIPEPPRTIATAGTATVEPGIGSYCWPGETSAGPGICIDKAGTVTNGTPLRVPAGESISVAHPLPGTPLVEVAVRVRPAPADAESLEGGELLWPPGPDAATVTPARQGDAIVFSAPREPGTWLVELFLRFGDGDVTYGLLVDVP